MNRQQITDSAHPAAAAAPPPATDVRDGLGDTVASNDAAVASERIRALDALAQCMLEGG